MKLPVTLFLVAMATCALAASVPDSNPELREVEDAEFEKRWVRVPGRSVDSEDEEEERQRRGFLGHLALTAAKGAAKAALKSIISGKRSEDAQTLDELEARAALDEEDDLQSLEKRDLTEEERQRRGFFGDLVIKAAKGAAKSVLSSIASGKRSEDAQTMEEERQRRGFIHDLAKSAAVVALNALNNGKRSEDAQALLEELETRAALDDEDDLKSEEKRELTEVERKRRGIFKTLASLALNALSKGKRSEDAETMEELETRAALDDEDDLKSEEKRELTEQVERQRRRFFGNVFHHPMNGLLKFHGIRSLDAQTLEEERQRRGFLHDLAKSAAKVALKALNAGEESKGGQTMEEQQTQ